MQKIRIFYIVIIIFLMSFATIAECQDVQNNQLKFIKNNGHPIKIKDSTDFSDLKALDKVLKGKRIVLLGEFTHGAKEINLMKSRLINYLHKNLGFKVLLFESGIGELYSVNYSRETLSSREMIGNLTEPWRTTDHVGIMDFIKENKDLRVGGFDLLRTGRSFAKVVENLIGVIDADKKLNSNIERNFVEAVVKLSDQKNENNPAVLQERDKVVVDYRNFIQALNDNQKKLEAAGWDSTKLKIVKKTFENRIEYLNNYLHFGADAFQKGFLFRNSIMAENILWYATQLFPNEKIIITSHNYHIAKHNEKDLVMGKLLKDKLGKSIYSIGFFGGKGTYATNSRRIAPLAQPTEENDIRTVINRIENNEATFLKIPEKQTTGSEWLFANLTINNSFVNLDSFFKPDAESRLIPQKSYDGLILINQISPPEFVS